MPELKREEGSGPALLAKHFGAPPFPIKRGECVMCGGECDRTVWICPECRPESERLRLLEEEALWQKRFQVAIHGARATIPERFADVTFDHPHLATIPRSEVARLISAKGDITIVGKSGSRKTKLAVALLRHLIDEGVRAPKSPAGAIARGARFELAVEIAKLRQFADAPRPYGVDAPEILEADRASLLVLDDVGNEGGDRSRIEVISELYQVRHQDSRRTITTTFLYPEEATARYGEGVARRMYDDLDVLVLWVDPNELAAWRERQPKPR